MILESIVTTIDAAGQVNIAPMGPDVDRFPTADRPQEARFTLRPFESSRTYDNLVRSRVAVIHVTDDSELFARSAVDKIDDQSAERLVRPIEGTDWRVLRDCHRWFAVRIDSIRGESPRFEMSCRIERSGVHRPFFGFNRAKHAVIEAAILATRTHLIPAESIDDQMQRLQPLIDKTAGADEQRAFALLRDVIDERVSGKS